ncbi:SGNH/GDSL hydrolase family protein [Streptomyces sp. NPDC048272]|uniref:SGNH/GDSL hydrolase family protein n=1 Tax=Streptomyces sp. NPDC048272 TaxID=3154616 RepID=UPI003439E215
MTESIRVTKGTEGTEGTKAGRAYRAPLIAAASAALLIAGAAPAPASAHPAPAYPASASAGAHRWTPGWATAVQSPSQSWYPTWAETGFDHQTVRQTVRVGADGSELRVRLSHAFGTAPLRLTGATVGVSAGGAAVRPGTVRALTFGGSASPSIRPGDRPTSDPVQLPVQAGDRLAVTLFFVGPSGPATFHNVAMETTYRADGDHRADVSADAFAQKSASWYFLEGVDVAGKPAGARRDTVVALGDSLTDGAASTPGADNRYPDQLSRRLAAEGRPRPVLNAGIGGNRVLSDSACFGEKATTRFRHDVLDQIRVGTVIVLEGTNDILMGETPANACTTTNRRVTAAELIEGHSALIRAARARGITVVGATLPPGKGMESGTPAETRTALNQWIRTSGRYDAVVDFDRVLADPLNPGRLLPAYDSGDGLHPNDAGYRAMADALDLDSL